MPIAYLFTVAIAMVFWKTPGIQIVGATIHGVVTISNMICVHNVVAASATVGLLGKEGSMIRKTLIPMSWYALFAGSLGQESLGAELKARPNELSSQALAREVGPEAAPGIQVGFSIASPLDPPIVTERTESDQLPILNRREKLIFPVDQVGDLFLNVSLRMSVDGVRRVVAPRNEFGRVIT